MNSSPLSGSARNASDLLDHAWRHFDFHAKQRLSLFNFCIIWAGLIIAAWSQAMTGATPRPAVGVILGLILLVSSVVFWRMDQRNAFLTKMAEEVLDEAEQAVFGKPVLFDAARADRKLRKGFSFLVARHWSHGQSLRLLFALLGIVGMLGASFSLIAACSVRPGDPCVEQQKSSVVTSRQAGPSIPPPSAAPQ